jgi:hypothetical protein
MQNSVKRLWLVLLVVAAERHTAFAQSGQGSSPSASSLVLDSLLHAPGPPWTIFRSQHFVVYVERGDRNAKRNAGIADSLESAWINAEQLVGTRISDTSAVPVLVTASRARFPRLMIPDNKGLTRWTTAGSAIIILVHNDSVKAYTRHEVMHLAAVRAWGYPRTTGAWINEGLATYADGRCQGTTIAAVARDLLRQSPAMTIDDATARFLQTATLNRARAYVLVGTIVGYLWESRGRDGVRALWQGRDSLATSVPTASAPGSPFKSDPTIAWHAYVARVAGKQPGIDDAAFRRAGCG